MQSKLLLSLDQRFILYNNIQFTLLLLHNTECISRHVYYAIQHCLGE
jgi:hypothetical protein